MKILVVDDSQLNLTEARKYLEDFSEITDIFLSRDPTKVKSIIDENGIDILILDIIMPDITGLDLLRQFRENPQYKDMPIIMLTSIDNMESYKTCFELGAFDYITKPINDIDFNVRLKVAINSKINSNRLKSLIEITQKQNEELKEINAKLTEAQFSLIQSEKMAAIGQLAAGIAHEINNPMGYMNSNFDILQKYCKRIYEFLAIVEDHLITNPSIGTSDPSITNTNYLEQINSIKIVQEKFKELKINIILQELDGIIYDSANGIQRVTEIVQSLRVFTRSSKDNEKDTYVLLDIIKQVILISKNEFKYVATVEVDVPDDIIIYCNRVQIGQVFVNLLVNAAQAIKSQERHVMGNIRIYARTFDQEIVIKFQDDGPGILNENLLKIFEPFFTTKEIGKGTGLGLSISYDIIVNKHQGLIDVNSEPGKGAIFTIILPIITTG